MRYICIFILKLHYHLDNCQWNEWGNEMSCSKACGKDVQIKQMPERRGESAINDTELYKSSPCNDVEFRTTNCTTYMPCPGIFQMNYITN